MPEEPSGKWRLQAAITCSALARRRIRFAGEKPTPGCQNTPGNNLGKVPGEAEEERREVGMVEVGKMLGDGGVRTLPGSKFRPGALEIGN